MAGLSSRQKQAIAETAQTSRDKIPHAVSQQVVATEIQSLGESLPDWIIICINPSPRWNIRRPDVPGNKPARGAS